MEDLDRKTALRMIPYGIYVMTTPPTGGSPVPHAATVNWVTQTSFSPPLVAVAVKADSGPHSGAKDTGKFVLNMLGKGQQGTAFTFFKTAELAEGKLSGEEFVEANNGSPILKSATAAVECKVVEIVEIGDHHIFVGEVTDVHIQKAPDGRPDEAILEMKELGDKVFYGG